MDIFNVIKDSGDGNVDASKLLIRALETRINKRLDLNDEKYNLEDYITYNKTENIEELTLNDIVTILNNYDNDGYENSDYYYYFIQNNKIYCGIKQQYTKINKK